MSNGIEKIDKLVSVLVISYNSSEYIIQTLESIKKQTYLNVELVVSDDFSDDNTIEKVDEWININSLRFSRVVVIRNNENLGIPKNINSGLLKCEGCYIKLIAADDVLDNNCIKDNYSICEEYGYRVVFSNMLAFYEEDINNTSLWEYLGAKAYFEMDSKMQHRTLAFKNFPYAPTSFFESKVIKEVGNFDERYKYMEDYPMWFKITAQGIKLNYLDKPTVFYRIHKKSISNSKDDALIPSKKYYVCERAFFYRTRLSYLLKHGQLFRLFLCLVYFVYSDMIILFGIKSNKFTKTLRMILLFDSSQFRYIFSTVIKRYR